MEIGLVLLWLGVATATSIIANSRGRNGYGWFVLGLFFSFFPLIILLILPSKKTETEMPEGKE